MSQYVALQTQTTEPWPKSLAMQGRAPGRCGRVGWLPAQGRVPVCSLACPGAMPLFVLLGSCPCPRVPKPRCHPRHGPALTFHLGPWQQHQQQQPAQGADSPHGPSTFPKLWKVSGSSACAGNTLSRGRGMEGSAPSPHPPVPPSSAMDLLPHTPFSPNTLILQVGWGKLVHLSQEPAPHLPSPQLLPTCAAASLPPPQQLQPPQLAFTGSCSETSLRSTPSPTPTAPPCSPPGPYLPSGTDRRASPHRGAGERRVPFALPCHAKEGQGHGAASCA